jgi:hypothetical protein
VAEDSEAGTILRGVAFGVGLLVVAYKAGRRVCKWRKAQCNIEKKGENVMHACVVLLMPKRPYVSDHSFVGCNVTCVTLSD